MQYTAPHWPWQAPGDEPYAVPAATDIAGRATHASNKSHQPGTPMTAGGSAATYATMMKALDDGIAEILAALDRHGLAANTLVIFTSDNGGERFSDMGPFSGRKMELREGGIRVPALLRWPRVLEAGREISQAVITMDWSATILAAARVRPHAAFPLDGIDLLPICRGEAPVQPRTFAWRTFQQTRHRALRHGDWKYLHDGEREYLFDLAGDPSEKRDLRTEHPERFEDLRRRLIAWEAQMLPPVPLGDAPD